MKFLLNFSHISSNKLNFFAITKTVVGSSPEPPSMLADPSAGMWIEKARLPCWPLYSQQVLHQRWISRIHCMQATKHASEGSTLTLKPRGDVTRSPKQRYQWPFEKDLCPPKKFLKKTKTIASYYWLFRDKQIWQIFGYLLLVIVCVNYLTKYPQSCKYWKP